MIKASDATCIILAGGLGTRLRDTIGPIPKCMAPVCGKPFLAHLLKYLQREGFRRIVLSLGHLHEQVEAWIGGETLDFEFVFSVEERPLGTGGAIALAMTRVETEHALIVNGDTFFGLDVDAFFRSHVAADVPLSIALKPMQNFNRYGNVRLDPDGRIALFEEKQYCTEGLINGGCYLLRRDHDLFDGQPERFSFETNILEPLSVRRLIHGYIDNGYFIDIGIPKDYERANKDFCKPV